MRSVLQIKYIQQNVNQRKGGAWSVQLVSWQQRIGSDRIGGGRRAQRFFHGTRTGRRCQLRSPHGVCQFGLVTLTADSLTLICTCFCTVYIVFVFIDCTMQFRQLILTLICTYFYCFIQCLYQLQLQQFKQLALYQGTTREMQRRCAYAARTQSGRESQVFTWFGSTCFNSYCFYQLCSVCFYGLQLQQFKQLSLIQIQIAVFDSEPTIWLMQRRYAYAAGPICVGRLVVGSTTQSGRESQVLTWFGSTCFPPTTHRQTIKHAVAHHA